MTSTTLTQINECYRCGYDLRGIVNDQPCPECGLLAERSRRLTDELHNTRPQWLRNISLGVWLILLALLAAALWPLVSSMVLGRSNQLAPRGFFTSITSNFWSPNHLNILGFDLAALMLLTGGFLLTARERYEPADRGDARRRRLLRIFMMIPSLAFMWQHLWEQWMTLTVPMTRWTMTVYPSIWYGVPGLLIVSTIPLPVLLFYQLRSLANRARSVHLAEHCAIVGIGATISLLYVAAMIFVMANGRHWFGEHWLDRSMTPLFFMTISGTAAGLFIVWSLYLLVRFAIAFQLAAWQLQSKWLRDDRAQADGL